MSWKAGMFLMMWGKGNDFTRDLLISPGPARLVVCRKFADSDKDSAPDRLIARDRRTFLPHQGAPQPQLGPRAAGVFSGSTWIRHGIC
jgi:hypothetical protein